MNILRRILDLYRRVQYFIFNRYRFGVMEPGVSVNVEPFRFELNHGDVVHPCVRYISEGYLGHNWWMVYTPYYNSNSALEQPVLCYAETKNPNEPPINWKTFCIVKEKPSNGYNSDPTLLYSNGVLYVFWRENYCEKTHNIYRATYVARVTSNGVEQISNEPVLYTNDSEIDNETCPTFMPDYSSKDEYICYAMHLRFHLKWLQRLSGSARRIVDKLLNVFDLLGLYSQQKHYGVAIWRSSGDATKQYRYLETVRFKGCNHLYRPWHMDFFDWGGKRFAIVQTNQCNADICLAYSNDGINFTFYHRPLITNATIGMLGIYKPCAGVTPDGSFYLYYTAQKNDDRGKNHLFLTTAPISSILCILS